MKFLKTTVDAKNVSFLDAARSAGYVKDHNELSSSVFIKKGSYSAFVELHIEQGPILEEEGENILLLMIIFLLLDILNYHQFNHFQSRYIYWYCNCHRCPCKYQSGI